MAPFSIRIHSELLAAFEVSSPKISPFNIVIGCIIAAVTLLVITLLSWRIGSVCLRRFGHFRNAAVQTNTVGDVSPAQNTNNPHVENIALPVPSLSRHFTSSSQVSIPPPYDTRSPPAYNLTPINGTADGDGYWRRLPG